MTVLPSVQKDSCFKIDMTVELGATRSLAQTALRCHVMRWCHGTCPCAMIKLEFGEFYVDGSQVSKRIELCPHPGPCKPREEIYEVHLIICTKKVLSADGGTQVVM